MKNGGQFGSSDDCHPKPQLTGVVSREQGDLVYRDHTHHQ